MPKYPRRRGRVTPVAVPVVDGVEVHVEDLRLGIVERQLDPEPDVVQRRGDAGAVTVELLGELLGDRAAARILAVVQGGERGSSGAVEDVDQEVGVEVLVLDGHHGVTQPGGGPGSGVRSRGAARGFGARAARRHPHPAAWPRRPHPPQRTPRSIRTVTAPNSNSRRRARRARGPAESRFARFDTSRRRPRRPMRHVTDGDRLDTFAATTTAYGSVCPRRSMFSAVPSAPTVTPSAAPRPGSCSAHPA